MSRTHVQLASMARRIDRYGSFNQHKTISSNVVSISSSFRLPSLPISTLHTCPASPNSACSATSSQVPTCFFGLCKKSQQTLIPLPQHTLLVHPNRLPTPESLSPCFPMTLSITQFVPILEYSLDSKENFRQIPLWWTLTIHFSSPLCSYPIQARASCWFCLPMPTLCISAVRAGWHGSNALALCFLHQHLNSWESREHSWHHAQDGAVSASSFKETPPAPHL